MYPAKSPAWTSAPPAATCPFQPGTSATSNIVGLLAYITSDPPTAADWQTLADEVNELIAALRR